MFMEDPGDLSHSLSPESKLSCCVNIPGVLLLQMATKLAFWFAITKNAK